MANNNTRMVTLRSSDEVEFEVPAAVAAKSKVVRLLIEDDDCVQDTIPIYNVDSKTLSKVIEYCTMHLSNSESEEKDLKQRDAEFIDNVDLDTLCNLLNAANYLDIRGLLDIACQRVADMIKGKSPEDQLKLFKIKNDFTPEEEEEIRRENPWAFEENA